MIKMNREVTVIPDVSYWGWPMNEEWPYPLLGAKRDTDALLCQKNAAVDRHRGPVANS